MRDKVSSSAHMVMIEYGQKELSVKVFSFSQVIMVYFRSFAQCFFYSRKTVKNYKTYN